MEHTVKLTIAFDGTGYSGWQRQKNAKTIQQTIEEALAVIIDAPVTLHGAGRTDAGVHAQGMTAHFQTHKTHKAEIYQKALNSMLPKDIRIIEASDKQPGFHARFSAQGKIYSYHIFTGELQLPHRRLYAVHIPHTLNIEAMQNCLAVLTGTHDFSSFEASGSRDKTITTGKGAVRTIYQAELEESGQELIFTFCGDGFLRHMVRNMVGTIIEVGRDKRSVAGFRAALQAKDRSQGGSTAPAHGLFLDRVLYSKP